MIRTSLILILVVQFNTIVHAQKDSTTQRNIVKFNFSSLLFKTACIQYERLLTNKLTATCNIIYRPNAIFSPAFTTDSWYYTNEKISVIAFTPSFRYYMGRRAAHGFYHEIYVRYRRDAISANTTPAVINDGVFYLAGHENIFTAGYMIGCQLYRHENIVIDFWILGIGFGSTSFKSSSKFEHRDQFSQMSANTKESYIQILKNNYGEQGTIDWDGERAVYSNSRLLIPVRGIGINVGIRF